MNKTQFAIKMTCRNAKRRMNEVLDIGPEYDTFSIDPALISHLETCKTCSDRLTRLQKIRRVYNEAFEERHAALGPPSFPGSYDQPANTPVSRHRFRTAAMIAAAALLAVSVSTGGYYGIRAVQDRMYIRDAAMRFAEELFSQTLFIGLPESGVSVDWLYEPGIADDLLLPSPSDLQLPENF